MAKFAKKEAADEGETSVKSTRFSKKSTEDKAPAKEKASKGKAKAEKAPKAAKGEPKERLSKTDERKITVHTKVNPHREGSGRYDAYEAAKSSKRVSDYLEQGHKGKYLKKWEEQGFIELT